MSTRNVQFKRHFLIGNHSRRTVARRLGVLALPALLGTTAVTHPTVAQRSGVSPDTLAIRGDTYFLAHDALLGRATGSRGAEMAAEYIASRCLAMGLDPVGSRYLHPVPLMLAAATPARDALTLTTADGTQRFAAPSDVLVDLESARTLHAFRGGMALIQPEEIDSLREDAEALSGLVVVTNGLIDDRHRVGEALRARGARGLVQLVDRDSFERLADSWSESVQVLLADDLPTSRRTQLPAVIAGPSVAAALAAARGREPGTPDGLTLEVRPSVRVGRFTAHNVLCRLAGDDPAMGERHVTFVAHYDHLGVRHGLDSDSIYNGFSDNAAGVAMVLAIAGVLTQDPLRAPALFLFFVAEEVGLLGSDYFVAAQPIPLARIGAVLNIDAGAPPGPLSSWRVATSDSGLAEIAMRVGAARGWSISISPARPNSDHFPFARHRVPAALLVPGAGPYDGLSANGSDTLRARWERYHQAADEWSPAFPWAGLHRYAELALELARALDAAFPRANEP